MRRELQKLLRGSTFIFSCRVAGAILAFLTQILLARWMGTEQLGYYIYAFSLSILLSTIAGVGYPAASLRVIGHNLAHNGQAYIRGFIQYGWRIIAIVSLIAAGAGTTITLAMQDQIPAGYVIPIVIATLSVPVFALLRFNLRVAHAMSWFKLAFLPNMVIRPLLFFLAVIIVWQSSAHLSANAAMLLQLIALGLVTLAQFIILRRMLNRALKDMPASFDKQEWFHIAAPLLLITIFTQYFPEISIIIIGTILPPDEIAVFNASYRIALLIAFGLAAVNSRITPQVSRQFAAGDRDAMQKLVALATQIKFWPSLFALLALAIFGQDILRLFGENFVTGYEALLLLGLAQLVLAAVGPVDLLLSITGHQNLCLMAFASSMGATVGLNLVLVPIFGINGAAAAVLIVILLWAIWLHILVVRHLGIHPSVLAFKSAF